MNVKKKTKGSTTVWLALLIASLLIAGGVCWSLWPVNHTASGTSQRDFTIDVDFDKFRQIMVRKNATEAIVAHSGMKLLNEKVVDLSIDLPKQKRPILNALLGRSKAELTASKQITVSLASPDIAAQELTLNQHSQIDAEQMDVISEASEPAGNLTAYSTRLHATKRDAGTKVELTIAQTVNVRVAKIFVAEADRRVRQSAAKSTEEQEKAIRAFIGSYQNDAIILPDLH